MADMAKEHGVLCQPDLDLKVVVLCQLSSRDRQRGGPMQPHVLWEANEDRLVVEDALPIVLHLGVKHPRIEMH